MNKKDLKNEMIVETRHGTRYLYCEGVMRSLDSWNVLANYTDNLNNIEFRNLDIVKVYENTGKYSLNTIFKSKYLKLIWQRPEIPELSEREIEVLKALDVIGYTHIARDTDGSIFAFLPKPTKYSSDWFFKYTVHPDERQSGKLKKDLFSFVKWEDEEPTSIKKLLDLIKE